MKDFLKHPDVIEAVQAWAKGHMTSAFLIERLTFLRDQCRKDAQKKREAEKPWVDVVYGEAGFM